MKTYNHPNRTDLKHLLNWLYCDYSAGGREVKDYNKFCKLAKEVVALGYKTDTLIPESDFNKAIEEVKQREKRLTQYQSHSFHRPKGKVAQDSSTVALLDIIEGYHRPGGAQDIHESDLVEIDDIFKPKPKLW